MKKISITIYLFLISLNIAWAQSFFGKTIFNPNDSLYTINYFKTSKSEFVVLRQTFYNSSSGSILKFDSNGNLTHSRKIIIDSINSFVKVRNCIETKDKGFLISGARPNNYSTTFLIKLDSNLNLQWSHKYHRDSAFWQQSLQTIELNDGSYILSCDVMKPQYNGMAVTKLDAMGNLLWSKMFTDSIVFSWNGLGPSVSLPTPDNGFVISGTHVNGGIPDMGMFIIKFDSIGIVEWYKIYQFGDPSTITQCQSGGYVIYESTVQQPMIKISSSGAVEWMNYYDWGGISNRIITKIFEAADSSLLFSFSHQDSLSYLNTTWCVKTNSNGDTLWTNQFRGIINVKMYQANDTIMLVGNGVNLNLTLYNMSLVSFVPLDSSGNYFCNSINPNLVIHNIPNIPYHDHPNYIILYDTLFKDSSVVLLDTSLLNLVTIDYCDLTETNENFINEEQLRINPNPNHGDFIIRIPDEFKHEKKITLQIFDNTGKLLQQTKVEMQQEKVKVNLEAVAKGVYNVILSNGKKSYNGKIVFE